MGNYGRLESSYFPQTMASPRVQSSSQNRVFSRMDQNLDRFSTGRESLSVIRNVSNLGKPEPEDLIRSLCFDRGFACDELVELCQRSDTMRPSTTLGLSVISPFQNLDL